MPTTLRCLKSLYMKLNWLKCREGKDQFRIFWDKGSQNLAGYHTKHHPQEYHQHIALHTQGDSFDYLLNHSVAATSLIPITITETPHTRVSVSLIFLYIFFTFNTRMEHDCKGLLIGDMRHRSGPRPYCISHSH